MPKSVESSPATGETKPVKSAEELEATRSPEEREKRRKIATYLRGIESREESIFRLSPDPRFFTDPSGIDPLDLFPSELRRRNLGNFVGHGEVDVVSGEIEKYPDSRLKEITEEVPRRDAELFTSLSLQYKRGIIEVAYHFPGSIECTVFPDDVDPTARWRIWVEETNEKKKLLGLDIQSSLAHEASDEAAKAHGVKEAELDQVKFFRDPHVYIEEVGIDPGSREQTLEREKKFLKYWRAAFGNLHHEYQWLNFYPGQRSEAGAGVGVDILERAIQSAREHGYDGISATPAYFHIAENFEKQGLRFENQEDAERMAMIKMALRAMDEQRYERALEDAFARGLDRDKAHQEAGQSILTPQERSWIVLLNSLRSQEFIPTEFSLKLMLQEAIQVKEAKITQLLLQADEVRRRVGVYATASEEEYDALRNSVESKLSPQERLIFSDYGTGHWVGMYYDNLTLLLLRQRTQLRDWIGRLQKVARLDFVSRWDDHKLVCAWDSNKMSLRFEDELKTPEFAQDQIDELIANEVVTGNTLNPPHSYVEELLVQPLRSGPPYTVVYHMYGQNGKVTQEDGSLRERKNVEHFAAIKSHVETVLKRPTRGEKAFGNVRNPGPNRSYGWVTEEPSVWNDELRHIERSEQNALIVSCATLEELERVAQYLHEAGYKEKENETGNDPRWFVPDIRVFGVTRTDVKKLAETSPVRRHLREALLHVKQGRKDGYASTITHETHRMVSGYAYVPVLIHEAMDRFISKGEEQLGEYEFVSR